MIWWVCLPEGLIAVVVAGQCVRRVGQLAVLLASGGHFLFIGGIVFVLRTIRQFGAHRSTARRCVSGCVCGPDIDEVVVHQAAEAQPVVDMTFPGQEPLSEAAFCLQSVGARLPFIKKKWPG